MTKRLLSWTVAGASALCISVAGCSGGTGGSDVTRTDSAGISIVANSGADRALDWEFTPLLTLGGADEGPEAFYSLWRRIVATGRDGGIYVIDRSNSRVVAFDSAGGHLWSVGREGGGPGEFRWPAGVTVGPDGTVEVMDVGNRKIERIAGDGELLGSVSLDFESALMQFARVDEGLVLELRQGMQELTDRLVLAHGADTTELTSVTPPGTKVLEVPNCPIQIRQPPIFAPELTWAAGWVSVVVNEGPEYAISLFEGTRQVASYRRDVEPRQATAEIAAGEFPDGLRLRGGAVDCSVSAEDFAEARGYAPLVPSIRELLVEPDGTIWVQRDWTVPGEHPIDVMAPDGAYLGTLPSEVEYPIAFTAAGHAVVIETDDLDVQRLVVYRVDK